MEVFEVFFPGELALIDAVGDFFGEVYCWDRVVAGDAIMSDDFRGDISFVIEFHLGQFDEVLGDDIDVGVQRACVTDDAFHAANAVLS